MTTDDFFVWEKDQEVGPVSLMGLYAMANRKLIEDATPVRRATDERWSTWAHFAKTQEKVAAAQQPFVAKLRRESLYRNLRLGLTIFMWMTIGGAVLSWANFASISNTDTDPLVISHRTISFWYAVVLTCSIPGAIVFNFLAQVFLDIADSTLKRLSQ